MRLHRRCTNARPIRTGSELCKREEAGFLWELKIGGGRKSRPLALIMDLPANPRILIIRLSAIGDCVMASPIPQALRAHFPDAHIAWAVRDKSRAVVSGNPCLDEIIPWHGGLGGLRGAAKLVRARRFDVVLETQGLIKSTLLMALSGAPHRLVSPRFGALSRALSTQIIEHPPGWIYPPDRYLYWAKALGAPLPQQTRLFVPQSDTDRAQAARFLSDNGVPDGALLIGINAGCSAPARKWSVLNFAAAANALAAQFPDARFVLLGSAQDCADTAQLLQALPPQRAFDAAGQLSLRASAALIARCAVLLTGDTGPMHLSVAVGTPVVAICGPIKAAHRLPLHDPQSPHIGIDSPTGRIEDVAPTVVVEAARQILRAQAKERTALRKF